MYVEVAVSVAVELRSRWPLADAFEVRDELLSAYGDPARRYHDLTHLCEVLDRIDELSAALLEDGRLSPDELLSVRLAAWFHDGVYDEQPDPEGRSAEWAEHALAGRLPAATVAEIARLVRSTADHRPADDDLPGPLHTDADQAILAAPAPRYRDYVAAVREEYAAVTDPDFRAGRTAILRDLLAKPALFQTEGARARWEDRARANVVAELAELAG